MIWWLVPVPVHYINACSNQYSIGHAYWVLRTRPPMPFITKETFRHLTHQLLLQPTDGTRTDDHGTTQSGLHALDHGRWDTPVAAT